MKIFKCVRYSKSAAAAAKSLQSCPTLCNPIDSSPPGFPIPGILLAWTLEWVAISFSNAEKWKVKVKSLSCVRLSNPMDCSLPGSSVHGIFQARVLELGDIAFSDSKSEESWNWKESIILYWGPSKWTLYLRNNTYRCLQTEYGGLLIKMMSSNQVLKFYLMFIMICKNDSYGICHP